MKIIEKTEVECGDVTTLFAADREYSFRISRDSGPLVEAGRCIIGNFDERLGMVTKMRRHLSADNLSVEIDSESIIPFGCEYTVCRQYAFAGNVTSLTEDILARTGGRIQAVMLEPLKFSGKVVEVSFWDHNLNKQVYRDIAAGKLLYENAEPLLFISIKYADGSRLDYGCGDDFWRHRAAVGMVGAAAAFKLLVNTNDELEYTRQIFALPEEIVPEKRPWRFQSFFAYSSKADPSPETGGAEWSGCFSASALRRKLRDQVRRNSNDRMRICGDFPHLCRCGEHLSRGGREIEHGDLMEVISFRLWATRELRRRGQHLMLTTVNELLRDTALLRELNSEISICNIKGE